MSPSIGGPVAPLTLVASDGVPIAATRYRSIGDTRGVVLMASATGVRQRYYRPFAEFLAGRGLDVLTWDWRGIGDSRYDAPMSHRSLSMRAWGERDLEAALAWARSRAGAMPLLYVGHSFGGQALGLAPSAPTVTRAAFIAAQHGYYGHWPSPRRWGLAALWHVIMPMVATVMGYFPSSQFRFGENLPGPVAREWAQWCRHREYLRTWSGHAALTLPILAFSFSDDWLAPDAAAAALLDQYSRADVLHRHLAISGAAPLGHFGFFRTGAAPALWEEVGQFLTTGHAPAGAGR